MKIDLEKLLFRETTTLGIRRREEERVILEREFVTVDTQYGKVRMKIASSAGEILNAMPEYEDCRRAAREHDVALRAVMEAAVAAYSEMSARRQKHDARDDSAVAGERAVGRDDAGGSALRELARLPYEDAGFARIDHHRALRLGLPEVIYAAGKTPAQVAEIFARMAAAGGSVLATRADADAYAAVKLRVPEAVYHEQARIIGLRAGSEDKKVRAGGRGLRGDQRFAGGGGSGDRRRSIWGSKLRESGMWAWRGCIAFWPRARDWNTCAGGDCVRRHGRRAAQRGRGAGGCSGDCGADQRGLRRGVWRRRGAAGHAEFLLAQCVRGEYRQRIWRGVCGGDDGAEPEPRARPRPQRTKARHRRTSQRRASEPPLGDQQDFPVGVLVFGEVLGFARFFQTKDFCDRDGQLSASDVLGQFVEARTGPVASEWRAPGCFCRQHLSAHRERSRARRQA